MKIKLLSKDVIEKIAAGEVVERPASVIKELVENSLDSGACRVEISFKNGGVNLIDVSDDGIGMIDKEIELALKRHATSKITCIDDLDSIETMGFRGEALSAIAAVSKISVISRSKDSKESYKYKLVGGQDPKLDITTRNQGTTVRVEDLFFNVPARKKFLKSVSTERNNIVSTVETISLARPDVSFNLKDGTKTVFDLPSSVLKERFLDIVSGVSKDKLKEIDFKNPYIKLTGFITIPEVSFLNRNKVYVFVNNRPVQSPVIIHAIREGYSFFIPSGRYPACVLNIEIEPKLFDVNVHPTKKEIRFVNQQGIHQIISKVIKNNLSQTPMVMELEQPEKKEKHHRSPTARKSRYSQTKRISKVSDVKTDYFKDIDLSRVTKFTFSTSQPDEALSDDNSQRPQGSIIPRFQWMNKYIIGEDNKGILVIDQHTAWERINYEKLKERFKKHHLEAQGNLIPEVIELEPSRSSILSDKLDLFKKFGLKIEEFGPRTYKINSVPVVAGRIQGGQQTRDMVENILEIIKESENLPNLETLTDDIIKVIACRSSIKAGDKMSQEEVNAMVKLLEKCSVPHRCPHGRPIVIRITEKELDLKFNR